MKKDARKNHGKAATPDTVTIIPPGTHAVTFYNPPPLIPLWQLMMVPVGLLSAITFILGMVHGYSNECFYESIASYFPPHVAGCELMKPRFK